MPSRSTRPVEPGAVVIALDVGGTSVKSGAVVSDQSVEQRSRFPIDSQAGADEILGGLARIIESHASGIDPASPPPVAIAFPSPFDEVSGIPLLDHKYGAIKGIDLARELRMRVPVALGAMRFVNDAAAAGAGAVSARGDADRQRVLVITLGTGMGASLFDHGHVVVEQSGVVVGHLWRRPTVDGRPADDHFSATGLARRLDIDSQQLASVLARPTADQRAGLTEWADDFARFLEPLINRLGIETLLIGGGVAGAFDAFAEALRARVDATVDVVDAEQGSAVLGAALLAFPELFDRRVRPPQASS